MAADWKEKYYQSLQELEDKEKTWSEVEERLRRGITRLTLVSNGLDNELDRQLEKLRKTVRNSRDEKLVLDMIDIIVETAGDLDIAKRLGDVPEPKDILLDFAQRLELPKPFAKRLKNFNDDLRVTRRGAAIGEQVKQLAALLGEASQAAGEPKKAGLFSSMFGKGDSASADDARGENDGEAEPAAIGAAVIGDLLERLVLPGEWTSDLDKMRAKATAVARETDLSELLRELGAMLSRLPTAAPPVDAFPAESPVASPAAGGETPLESLSEAPAPGAALRSDESRHGVPNAELLIQLLERLDLTREQQANAGKLKAELEQGAGAEQMPRILASIADLVAHMRAELQREKQEIQEYLKQLTERLRELDMGFQFELGERRKSFESGKQLDQAVQDQVRGIESSVRDAADLDGLKQDIQRRLEHIRGHMEKYRGDEDVRQGELEERVKTLNEKIKHMEQESDGLRARLQEQHVKALTDPLTGIPNRLAYNERAQHEYSRWRRYKAPLSLIVWDIDKFKSINDTYGHKAGDKVLATVARLLQTKIRDTDFLARYGGEEFVLLLPETDLQAALIAANKLRVTVEACDFHYREKPVPITASGGVTQMREGESLESAFERADQNMYRAKQAGRNQCMGDA